MDQTEASNDKPATPPGTDTARSAGRGGLAIAAAKVSFILVGFVQQLILPRVVDVDGFGAISRMLSVVSIVNNVMVAMSIQGVSRVVAGAHEGEGPQTYRRVLLVHAVVAMTASTIFAAVAGTVANAVEAPQAAVPLRIAAGVVLAYGVYAPLVGHLNGSKRFIDQAGLDIAYGVSRAALLVGGAWAAARLFGMSGATGAAAGFVTAAMLIIPVALWRSGVGRSGVGGPTVGAYLSYLGPLFVMQLGLNLLLQTDLLLLSRAAGAEARAMGLEGAALEKAADEVVGIYRGVQLFGFLPYQLLMSVQFVLFPMLARAHADHDDASVAAYTKSGIRLALILTGLIAGTIAALGPFVLRFAFPDKIAFGGADAIRFYAPGLGAFAILGVASAALNSLRKEISSAVVTWVTAGLVFGAVTLTRPAHAFGKTLVDSTALATSGAMIAAAVVAAILLRRAAGAFASPLTLLRVVVAMGITIASGYVMPWMGKLVVLVQAAALAVLYLGLLVAMRELGRADLDLVLRVVGRKKKPA